MRRSKSSLCVHVIVGFLALQIAKAQVVAPVEMKDPELRSLQMEYMDDLKAVGAEINNLPFEYPFYLSKKLDLDEQQQKAADQRSIRFDHYNGKTVLAITGNYYAAYSTTQLSKDQRARKTFLAVIDPILKVTVPKFQTNANVQGYAFEVSHHVVGTVMGVSMERPENLMVFLPQNAALKLLAGKTDTVQQAALLEGQYFLNAEPVTIWLNGEGAQLGMKPPVPESATEEEKPAETKAELASATSGGDGYVPPINVPLKSPKRSNAAEEPPKAPPVQRDVSSEVLSSLQTATKQTLDTMTKELDSQVHFVSYAPASFVAFRQEIFLEISLNTNLSDTSAGSRYKMAAEAFDDHIAHLIRPVLGYFKPDPKEDPKFDGIGFSTTLHLAGKTQSAQGSEAVEFFFPLAALRCYEKYDCTGQQLIDAGVVLINGERVSLDLQIAEGGAR
jgi:hypothetical protein